MSSEPQEGEVTADPCAYLVRSKRGEPTWELALFFPRQGDWCEAEYLALNTNRFVELSNGCLEFPPVPTFGHQRIVGFLAISLSEFVKGQAAGVALFAPLPVRLWKGTFRMPDVMFFRPHRIRDVHSQPDGADLVMEVVSPGEESRQRDLVTKREEYARAGIDEYWIVDPPEQRVTVFARDGQTYRAHGVFSRGEQASSVLLPGFLVDVTAVFAAAQGHA